MGNAFEPAPIEFQSLCLQFFHMLGLELVEQKGGKFNFRCPVCGDSKRSKYKKRGWYDPTTCTFSCFNCNHNKRGFMKFIESEFPFMVDQFKSERKKLLLGGKRDGMIAMKAMEMARKQISEQRNIKMAKVRLDAMPSRVTPFYDLPSDHPARVMVERRQIPEKFKESLCMCDEEDSPYYGRLLIPMLDAHGNCYGYQGRSLDGREPKYMTDIIPGRPKIWGYYLVDKTKPVYVFEGIFDAMFVDNSIAMTGSDIDLSALDGMDLRFVFDNSRIDDTGKKKAMKYAEMGKKVFIWPKTITCKDVNDCVLSGIQPSIFTEERRFQSGKLAVVTMKMTR